MRVVCALQTRSDAIDTPVCSALRADLVPAHMQQFLISETRLMLLNIIIAINNDILIFGWFFVFYTIIFV